ncbi:hypothetical protein [Riemerella anatipestifer]|uniref:hypothetical protein n=1 Tax=Riemerella anatipestifer TaxID=34085 RepID=UPI00129D8518|nr:hypothetical protein [Riemerella anatipestifer]
MGCYYHARSALPSRELLPYLAEVFCSYEQNISDNIDIGYTITIDELLGLYYDCLSSIKKAPN